MTTAERINLCKALLRTIQQCEQSIGMTDYYCRIFLNSNFVTFGIGTSMCELYVPLVTISRNETRKYCEEYLTMLKIRIKPISPMLGDEELALRDAEIERNKIDRSLYSIDQNRDTFVD